MKYIVLPKLVSVRSKGWLYKHIVQLMMIINIKKTDGVCSDPKMFERLSHT